MSQAELFVGNSLIKKKNKEVAGEYVELLGESYYKISNFDLMSPFFMTIVSPTDHWLFISSNGAATAGRKNPESALFPYYTDDKIIDSVKITGGKSLFQVKKDGKTYIWQPFSVRYGGLYNLRRNIYKNRTGNKIVFEEINEDLDISFKYLWTFSDRFGFVKKTILTNRSNTKCSIEFLDGIRNILPYGVASELQNSKSTLVDAYKKNELDSESGLGIFSLSAMIVDKAEASEALLATCAWSVGVNVKMHLLSTKQLNKFRNGFPLKNETDCRAERGAYFINGKIDLLPKSKSEWYIVSDVNQSLSDLIALKKELKDEDHLLKQLIADLDKGDEELRRLVGMADGIQLSKDKLVSGRHFSNVLFNIMRGGVFADQYTIYPKNFIPYIKIINQVVYKKNRAFLEQLPKEIKHRDLLDQVSKTNDQNLVRICTEYLPLSFSRRHGDPSRPWNYFSIEIHDEAGNKIKNYEGNWRDIFQNWEALAFSFPEFVDGMINKFLNATTIDGYNPYRITRDGIDWETIEENDPWSFIGYWGDHQIIYLLKLLELSEKHYPGKLTSQLSRESNVYANVPYRIKGYDDILKDPSDTIDFDHELAHKIEKKVAEVGSDGKLVWNASGDLVKASLAEKILVTGLTKLYNFIPEAGIWLNTQRPEWNDANNALVGNGVSMVTLYYLKRFLVFTKGLFEKIEESIEVNTAVAELLKDIFKTLDNSQPLLAKQISDHVRKRIVDELGRAGEKYRNAAYAGFNKTKIAITSAEIIDLFDVALEFLEHSIRANKREDGLYHAYNLIEFEDDNASIDHLNEMLEGQVAVLSANYLSADECVSVLDAMKSSKLFRADQYSYMLYPDQELPTFLEKNTIPQYFCDQSKLMAQLVADADHSIVEKDIQGQFHFNGNFHNSNDLKNALDQAAKSKNAHLVKEEYNAFMDVFEQVFDHKSFTGRSGTFYAYEGLGSIYWHMVSKLLLAVQENIYLAKQKGVDEITIGNLVDHYYEVRAGIGLNKSPELYGAFPTDAYSHTPKNAGAQQPGMTGQVKEDIINRWAELGVIVKDGKIHFGPLFLKKEEFLDENSIFEFYDVDKNKQSLQVASNSLAFTYCQVPVIYNLKGERKIEITFSDGSIEVVQGDSLPAALSKNVFSREGKIKLLKIGLSDLKP